MQPGRAPPRAGADAPGDRARRRRDAGPARAARPRAPRGGAPCSRCCAPASSRSGPRVPAFEAAFAARVGARARQRRVQRHRRAAPRAARGRRGGRRRGRHVAVLVRGLGQRGALRARAAGVRRHRPGDAQPRPARPRPRRSRERTTALLPVHIFGYPADMPALRARSGCRSSRTPARRSARVHADGSPVGGRGHPAVFGFYANKQLTTGEGGMVTIGRRRRTRSASTPSATRAARPTWAGSTTTGSASTTACRTSRARSGSPSSSASTACSPAARGSPALYREALAPASRASALPCPDAGGDAPRLVRLRRPAPARRRPRRRRCVALRERGVQSKPYLPAIHLMTLLPRALRPPRGRVPGLRGRRRALARAAVLPGDDRGPGRAGRRGARRACSARQRLEVADEAGAADRARPRGRRARGAARGYAKP